MENFGLGLILNFQDNASMRISGVIGVLGRLQDILRDVGSQGESTASRFEAIAKSVGILGAAITAMGGAATAAFASITKSLIHEGMLFEQAILQLQQLYGSYEKGKEKYFKAEQIAARTPMTQQEVIQVMSRGKALDLDVDEVVKTKPISDASHRYAGKGATERTIVEAIGDLVAIRPDKGFETALREAIEFFEGNSRPLRMSYGLNPILRRLR